MTHKYNVSGMTCEGCAEKIKTTIEQVPDIESAEVNLEEGYVTIKMNKHFTVDELQKILDPLKKYTISETSSGSNTTFIEENKSWFSTYKPLILIFLYIIGISVYVSTNKSNFDDTNPITITVGGKRCCSIVLNRPNDLPKPDLLEHIQFMIENRLDSNLMEKIIGKL